MPLVKTLILLLGLTISSCAAQVQTQAPSTDAASATTSAESARPTFDNRNPRYQVCRGDVMDIAFPYSPEFNQTVTIQPDGYITLQEIGELYVADKTVPELVQTLKTAYGTVLHEPVLTVTLKDFNKPYFTVGGQVQRPGKFELRADTSVTEAIAIAGGFTDSAKHSQVLLVRKVSNEWAEVKKLNVKEIYKGNMREDLHLRSGDMLYVPKNKISKIKPFLPVYGFYANLAQY